MKIVIAPDSFKGSLSAFEVAETIKAEFLKSFSSAKVEMIPFTDGGEGSIDCFFSAIGGNRITIPVRNPLLKTVMAEYLLKDNLAVIESAQACGLTLIEESERNPLITTTFGVGELIKDALDKGAKKIILTLGGSATNDGGTGMANALSARFLNSRGKEFLPTGHTLSYIQTIDLDSLDKRVHNTEFIGMCDVNNTISGKLGASQVYAPQKGAKPEDIPLLDDGLCNLANILSRMHAFDYFALPGGGAAGGLGLAVKAFLKGSLVSGIDLMMDTSEFDEKIKGADLLITGEGRLDEQSFMGKVIDGMSKKALKYKVPLIIIAGSIASNVPNSLLKKHGVILAEPTNISGKPFEEIKNHAKRDLALATERVIQKYRALH